MSATDVRVAVASGRQSGHGGFIEGTGAVPLAATLLLGLLTLPIYVLAPSTVPAALALLAAGAAYLVGTRRMREGRTGGRRIVLLASLGGLGAIALAWFTSWHLAGRYDAHAAVTPCCTVAFAVPAVVYALAAAVVWRRARGARR